jgi:hypothetical protein
MRKRWYLIIGLCLIFVPLVASRPLQDQAPADKPQSKVLKVTVSFQGKGKVDGDHGIFLFLFDSPDFVQNPGSVMPIAFQATHSNGETVSFSALKAENVYLAAVFDENGGYSPSAGAPPSGVPVAVYKPGDPAMPTPIKLEGNKEVEIQFSFDDSLRMP